MSLKTFSKSLVVYSIGVIALRLVTFILIPIYTHNLSVSDFGLLMILLGTADVFISIVDFGTLRSIVRFSNEYKQDNKRGLILGSSLIISTISGFSVLILAVIFLPLIFKFFFDVPDVAKYAILVVVISIFSTTTSNILSYFRALNNVRSFTVYSILMAIGFALATIFFVVVLKWGITGVLLAQICIYGLFTLILLIKLYHEKALAYSKETINMILKFGFPLIFARLSEGSIGTIISYMLSFFASLKEVGIYSLASKMTQVITVLVITPFQMSYEPYIYTQLDQSDLDKKISSIVTYFIIGYVTVTLLLLIVYRDLIKLMAPKEYYSAFYLSFFLVPLYLFKGIQLVAQSLLFIKNFTKSTGWVMTSSAMITIIIGYLTIKPYGIWAAVFANNLFWFIILIVLLKLGLKTFPIRFEMKRILTLGLIYLIFNFAVYFLSDTSTIIYYSLIILLILITFVLLIFTDFLNSKEKLAIKKITIKYLRFIKKN
ncbi:MAG: oligosaccharide flippase family protein [Ignavibacteriota bacterium]